MCALLLARAGMGCSLVDARALEALERDQRLLALSRGSLNLLESLLGPGFAPMAAIERVHVSSRGNPGAVQLGAQDFDGLNVGATIWYADLVAALARAAQSQALVRVQRPRRAVRVDQQSEAVRIALDDGTQLTARLVIDAEGTPALAPQAKYFALLADLELAQIAAGTAIERFTRDGPLALLPLPQGTPAAARTRMSMIWCQSAELARARLDMDAGQLCAQIGAELGPRLGAPAAVGPRHIFPLTPHRRAQVCEHRLVHLGNAAQTLHPVAGQGFNLGLRDCACLVEALIDVQLRARAQPSGSAADGAAPPADALAALALYRRRRRLDRSVVPALTGALPPLFSSSFLPLVAARSAALIALDTVAPLRRAFTRLLMFGAG